MKLEVGMYVRIHTGKIGKILKIDNRFERLKYHIDCEKYYCTDMRFKKYSKNLMDLIETDDYVNGTKVTDILKRQDTNETTELILEFGESIHHECDIKSIVTKEQFKRLEYRLEE